MRSILQIVTVITCIDPVSYTHLYAATGDFTRAYADIKENLRTAMEEFHEKVGEVRLDKKSIEESLHFQLVNTERTGEILNHMPHRDMGDMSVVYCWQVADEMIGKITNQVAKKMCIRDRLISTRRKETQRAYSG